MVVIVGALDEVRNTIGVFYLGKTHFKTDSISAVGME
jgi:hypothetical protein